MFRMRLIVLLLLVMTAVMFLIFLVDTAVHLLAEPTTMAEQTSLAFLSVAAESSRPLFSLFKLTLLRRRVFATLLSTTCGVWEPLVSGCFMGVLLIVDEVPALREMCTEILNDGTAQVKCYVGPSHTRALCPVKLVFFPMINSGEV